MAERLALWIAFAARAAAAIDGHRILKAGDNRGAAVPSTRLLWGQIIAVLLIALVAVWAATQWTAWRLGLQPQLGAPWFQMWPGIPIHHPQAFFWTSTAPMCPGSFSRARGANF